MKPTAGPRAKIETRPLVAFGTLHVLDAAADPPSIDGSLRLGELAYTHGSSLALRSGGNDFYPSVVLEFWAEQPEPPRASWEYVEEADINVAVGALRLYSTNGEAYGSPLTVSAGRYRVRICCRGRAQAPIGEPEYFEDGPVDDPVEWWLLQFWHLGASA